MKTGRSSVPMDFITCREIKDGKTGRPVIAKGGAFILAKPKQTLKNYLSHRRFTRRAQQARSARRWKDQACRWTDRMSRGARLRENWARLRLSDREDFQHLSHIHEETHQISNLKHRIRR